MTPEIVKLNEAINYQDGAVVSKEILKNSSGTVTLFAFDKDQGLSEHTAPYEATIFIIDGKTEIIIDKKPYHLETGELIKMPADHPHSVKAIEKFKMLLVMIKV